MVTDALGRLRLEAVDDLGWATKVVASFEYLDVRGHVAVGAAKFLVPPKDGPRPLCFHAGYELVDDAFRGFVALGCIVANPLTPTDAWPASNPGARSINLEVALLHIARSLDRVDDSRVVIAGASEGGWTTWMLTAETFPLAGSIPEAGQLNRGYCAWYAERAAALVADSRTALPAVTRMRDAARRAEPVLGRDHAGDCWFQHSPVAHVDAISSPVHALHATSDAMAPVDQVRRALRRAPREMPPGYSTDDGGRWVLLEDVVPDACIVPVEVPSGAELLEIDGERLDRRIYEPPASGKAPPGGAPLSLPDPKARLSICVVEDGGPGPRVGHYRYRLSYLHGAFVCRVLGRPCDASSQLTAGKRRVLEARAAGEEWIPTPVRHLDFPEAEAADLERAWAHVPALPLAGSAP